MKIGRGYGSERKKAQKNDKNRMKSQSKRV